MKSTRILSPIVAMVVSVVATACGNNSTASAIPDSPGGSPPGSGGSTTETTAKGGSTSSGSSNATGGATVATGQGGANTGGAANGGATATSTGGATGMGGATNTGGNSGSGGTTSAGGSSATGGATNTGGKSGSSGAPAMGGAATSGGSSATGGSGGGSATGPCDIYAAASPATPCVAAYSTTRVLSSKYTGPLYQVRKGGSWNKTSGMSGGTFQDIGVINGVADSAAQDTFCGTDTCTFSVLYDQSGKKNDLKVAPAGCYTGTASEPDSESNAKTKSVTLNGKKVYALYMVAHDGYRNNSCTGVPSGNNDNGIYIVADGTHTGSACCWDFGNVWGDNCNSHTMNTIFFGTGYWGKGAGAGPWFMGDFEGGVWAGGTTAGTPGAPGSTTVTAVANTNNPSMKVPFAFGILKTSPGKYAIRAADAQSGSLTTAYDGTSPKTWTNGGNIVLGTGGDNSNSSFGTFFEGADTAGRPSDATDAAVLQNVQAAGYGK